MVRPRTSEAHDMDMMPSLTDQLEELPFLRTPPLLVSDRLSRSDTGETVGDQEERGEAVPDGHDYLTVILCLGFTYQALAAGLSGRTWRLSRCAHCGTPKYCNLDNTPERRTLDQQWHRTSHCPVARTPPDDILLMILPPPREPTSSPLLSRGSTGTIVDVKSKGLWEGLPWVRVTS